MNTPSNSQNHAARNGRRISPVSVAVRSLFAVGVCVLAWLCIRAALVTERLARAFHDISLDPVPSELASFHWEHPRLLLTFAVLVALGTIASLVFSKVQRTAVLTATFAILTLLAQWSVVTSAVGDSTMRMMERLAIEVSK